MINARITMTKHEPQEEEVHKHDLRLKLHHSSYDNCSYTILERSR